MASVTELIKNIRNAIYGKDVRESIASAIEKTYEDAAEQGNANMEVSEARGTFTTLNNRLNNSDLVKADKTEVEDEVIARKNKDNDLQSQVNSLASGSPLVASSVDEMTDINRVYVNTSDGHWYTYSGTEWVDRGVYQAAEDSETVELTENFIKNATSDNGIVSNVNIKGTNTKTSFYLKEGITYLIKTDNLLFNCNCYVENDSSNYIALSTNLKKLTPNTSGYLVIYTNSENIYKNINIFINNGLLQVINNTTAFFDMLLTNSVEEMKETNILENYYINAKPSNIYINNSDVKIYYYDIEKTGNYAILGYGNNLVGCAIVNNDNTPKELIGKFTDDSDTEFKTNVIYCYLEKNTKIGVTYWKNEYFTKPKAYYIADDSIISDLKFKINSTNFPKMKAPVIKYNTAINTETGELYDAKSWRCFILDVESNKNYVIKYANLRIIEYLNDGTLLLSNLISSSTDVEDYNFTTSENTKQIGVMFYHNYNYVVSSDTETDNDYYQEKKTLYYERKLNKEPSILFSKVIPKDNLRINKDELYNIYKYPFSLTWGNEYLASFYKKIYENSNLTIDFDGDSITLLGHRQQCVKNILKIGGYDESKVTINNNGLGNRSTNEWAGSGKYYTVESDLETYPNGAIEVSMSHNPDLLVCGYGMNDAVAGEIDSTTIEERVNNFENNYREVLQRIRSNTPINGRPAYNKSAEELAIILCSPTTAFSDENNFRTNQQWFIYVREILKKLCREFQCGFCDFTTITYDHNWSHIWAEDGTGNLHPDWYYGLSYSSILQQLIYPMGLWKT